MSVGTAKQRILEAIKKLPPDATYADLLVERIVAAVNRLETFPRSGRVVPEVGDDSLREVVYENYLRRGNSWE